MDHLVRQTLAIAAAGALAAAAPTSARAQAPVPAVNSLQIVIDSGPQAGTYDLTPANTICTRSRRQKQLSAAYKNINAHDPKKVSGAAINVLNPDRPGPKKGTIDVTFGDPGNKRPSMYMLSIPGDSKGPLTMTKSGKTVALAFEGETKDGIKLKVTASCGKIDVF